MSDGLEVEAWRKTRRYSEVIDAVRTRLVCLGAVEELRRVDGMSAQELDVLVERER